MKWMIIILIMMSLIGSMMWVMPTPRQKYQAALRMKAKTQGFLVQLEKVTGPRAKGEMEPVSKDMTAYRILREGLSRDEKNSFKTWQVFRIESIADIGLPAGWSWLDGERTLSDAQLEQLCEIIAKLPAGVFSLESTPIHVGVYWDEEGGEEVLDDLKGLLQQIAKSGF